MDIWVIKDGEPLPIEPDARVLRTGLLAAELVRRGHTVTWWTSTFAHHRKVLLQNLVDEEGGTESHLEMFTRFGKALGLSHDQLESAPMKESTRALLDTFAVATADGSPAEGLVTLYAYESQAAEVAASKTESLMSRYGLTPGDGTDFWSVHAQADELHSAWERELLERLIQDPGPVVAAAGRASDALWGFLDGCSEVA